MKLRLAELKAHELDEAMGGKGHLSMYIGIVWHCMHCTSVVDYVPYAIRTRFTTAYVCRATYVCATHNCMYCAISP
jgi:hypothetical protein